jgi:nitroreductase
MQSTLDTLRARCGMDVMDAIYDRRAVRAYDERKVEADVVRRLIDAAIHAPSAVNEQPWSFVVLQDRAVLRRISDRAKVLSLAHAKPGTTLWDHRGMLEDPSFNVFYDGGTLILVCSDSGASQRIEDCCLAAQNLMLAAHGLGLGTCPIGFAREALNELSLKGELGIPAGHSVVMPILVGYPRERPSPPPRQPARIMSWK